jgi:hypothetical protein
VTAQNSMRSKARKLRAMAGFANAAVARARRVNPLRLIDGDVRFKILTPGDVAEGGI